MGGDIINMVDTAYFFMTVMLGCMTVLVLGATALLTLSGIGLAREMLEKIKYK